MLRRNFIKSLMITPFATLPALTGCNVSALRSMVRDTAERQPEYLLNVGDAPFGLGDHLMPLAELPQLHSEQAMLNLVVLGDSGQGDVNQQRVADLIAGYHASYPIDAMIHTGDIIYPKGLFTPTDAAAYTHFEHVYYRPDLVKTDGSPVPMYAVLGNHDHYGNADAMIAFATQYSQVLKLPASYYSINTRALGFPGPETEIFFLDSYPMIKNRYSLEQFAWLDQQLAACQAECKILVTHHPLRVYGSYQDSKFLRSTLEVLAEQYGVDICLAGHDHHLQLQRGENGITYMVSGGGGGGLRESGVGPGSLFSAAHFGAIAIQLRADGVRYIPIMQQDAFYPEYHAYEETLS